MTKDVLTENGFITLTTDKYPIYEKYKFNNHILDIQLPILLAYWDQPLYRIFDDIMLIAVKEENDYIFLPPCPDFKHGLSQIKHIYPNVIIGYMNSEQAQLCNSEVEYDARFSDYITKREELITLSWKYKHKLSDYNNFIKNNSFEVRALIPETANDCRTVLNNWCNGRDCSLCLFGCEKKVLEKYIELIGRGIDGMLVYSNGVPIGSLISCVYDDTLYYPYAKTDKKYNGLSVYMYVEHAKHFNAKYVNLGSDGGFEGIRRFKDKFKPYQMLNKYFTK